MADLHYSRAAAAVVTGGLSKIYKSQLDLNVIDEELCRVLLALSNDCTQPWLQRLRVVVGGAVRFKVIVNTPTGVDGDLAVFWELIEHNGRLIPYVSAIVPGYHL
jgi:hypothetical protein